MIKVFLAEDEYLVREGLRDNVPWEQCGYEFVGEAADGEMALPLIRKLQPDLLITDIKMPFMDGLELARLVEKELPETRIIIISGYDDFQFAQQAIELHVDRYLLKPITKAALIEVLNEMKEQFDRDREHRNFLKQFNLETQEYEQYARRKFFEELVDGSLSVSEIYDRALKLEIDIAAPGYNVVLFMLQPQLLAGEYSENAANMRDVLVRYFLNYPEYLLFRFNVMTYAVLIKGEPGDLARYTARCVDNIRERCSSAAGSLSWFVAVGSPVERVSSLPACFAEANHLLAYRHMIPGEHVFTSETAGRIDERNSFDDIANIDVGKVDPMVLRSFLQTGLAAEIDDFVVEYVKSLGSAMKSVMFSQYILLSARFNAAIMVKEFGYDQEDFLGRLPEFAPGTSEDAAVEYIKKVISTAVELRDRESRSQYSSMLKKAVDFIDSSFADENISLNAAAKAVNVSANYFSAVFSQEMGLTFVEYLTKKRMEKAKQLLRQSSKRSGEIAFEVGYRDPRYFSFIFKKTVGCTPRDYRAGRNN